MKKWTLSILAIIFFLVVNTSYFWQVLLGILLPFAIIILKIAFVALSVFLVSSFYFAFKEKFSVRHRIFNMVILSIVLFLTFYWPIGIVDFTQFERPDVLVVRSTGAGGCTNTMRFKKDGDYVEQIICFGIGETWGKYKIVNDTIYFLKEDNDQGFPCFAVLEACKDDESKRCIMTIYANREDTVGRCSFGVVKFDSE